MHATLRVYNNLHIYVYVAEQKTKDAVSYFIEEALYIIVNEDETVFYLIFTFTYKNVSPACLIVTLVSTVAYT